MHRVTCVAFLFLLVIGCAPKEETVQKKEAPAPCKVQTMTLTPQVWSQTIRTFGVLEAAEKVTLSAEFSARVNKVNFSEGQKIEAGHKLVEFDKAEQRMHSKQAESDIISARVKLEEARSLAKRREELFAKKAITKEQLDVFQTALANSEAKYQQALVGRSLARHNLNRTSLISPVSGRVATKSVEEGEVAMPGQPLAIIHVTDTMRVLTYVTEQEINSIQVGSVCTVTTPGVRGREYTAHVESRGGEVDPATGNFPVKLTVENSDGLLKPGMTAIVVLRGLEVGDAMLIPDTAVVDRNRKRVIFRVQNGTAQETEPILAATVTGDVVPVLHGLSFGDEIIVGGLSNVVDGTKIQVVRTVENGTSSQISEEVTAADEKVITDTSNADTEEKGSEN